MQNIIIVDVIRKMQDVLSESQLAELGSVMERVFVEYEVTKKSTELMEVSDSWKQELESYLVTKIVEGKSKETIKQYKFHLYPLLSYVNKDVGDITSDDIFNYIKMYKTQKAVSNRYLNNIRLVFSSFFTWLCNNGSINSNPIIGINKIKVPKIIRKPFSDEQRELLNCAAKNERDLALIEFLYSTGIRVGELCKLNKSDINFSDRDLIVYGKGSKERRVYITPKASVHLRQYLNEREDTNEALFVSLNNPHSRLTKNGVEYILKKIGERAGVENVHPHRFRRTMATNASNKGMPIQELSFLMGHIKIETTMLYVQIDHENIKYSHKKYLSA